MPTIHKTSGRRSKTISATTTNHLHKAWKGFFLTKKVYFLLQYERKYLY